MTLSVSWRIGYMLYTRRDARAVARELVSLGNLLAKFVGDKAVGTVRTLVTAAPVKLTLVAGGGVQCSLKTVTCPPH
jgi:hypothetical protein